ncbi:MAG: alpha/beta fold hydrolase, partial [Bacteroidia bacterium]
GCAPIALKCYPHLRERFQVFAVDVLAQPNKSAETRLSMKDESYGVWLNEVMAGLDIEEATLAGFSFGGLVILKTLIHNKKRVKEAFLAAPAYIVNGNPIEALFKVLIPMKRFIRKQNPKFIDKFLSVLFTEKDDFAAKFLPKVFSHFTMDFSPLPVLHKKEAQQINTPITLIAAQKDIFFPGKKMIKRAQKLLPSLKRTVLLDQSRHVQNSEDNRMIERLVMESSRGA